MSWRMSCGMVHRGVPRAPHPVRSVIWFIGEPHNRQGAPAEGWPASGGAVRDPPVVAVDLLPGLLGSERPGELVGAQLHRLVERMVEPHIEEPALGGGDRAGVRRGALE